MPERSVTAVGSVRFPMAVVMEKRRRSSGRWQSVDWEVVGFAAGERVTPRAAPVPVPGGDERLLWTGLELVLHKDGGEGYWYNISSDNPRLFVVCAGDETDASNVRPWRVTANQDEALSYMETEGLVLSGPMPKEIYHQVEQYVIEHYRPQARRKRSRRNWAGESGR